MTWTFSLCDRVTDATLADLTVWSTSKKVSARLNRPLAVDLTVPGDTTSLQGDAGDGLPLLWPGVRTVKAYQDGTLRGHTIVWNWGPSGDPNNTAWTLTGYDPMMLFPKRLVQEADGTFADPVFPSPISGAEIIQLALENTIANDGALPIDLTGPIASSADLAADLSGWPTTIADLVSTLTDTGELDIQMFPVDTTTGYAAGVMAQVRVADSLGSDLTATVHFDYGTGSYNVSNIRRSFDLDELCNKLYYYLGPRGTYDNRHYKGNITATETGLEAYAALQDTSRDIYGVFMDVKIFDDTDVENSQRKLFHQLWKTEVTLRVQPRELLYVTPAPGTGSAFRPFIDYNPGDVVSVNASTLVGPAISSAAQRIYGFDVEIDANGVERVSELIVSPDGV